MIGSIYHIALSVDAPMPPEDAELCIQIDFKRSSQNPRRVFDSMSMLIESFEKLDGALLETIDVRIEPLLLLEDIETGSIKVWLKNILSAIDDDALKTLDWKQQVGKYLVEAKYATLRWLDSNSDKTAPRLLDLKSELQKLAEQTDVRHLPDYPKIHDARLVPALEKIQDAKRQLSAGDRIVIQSDEKTYEVQVENTWSPSRSLDVDGGRSTFSEMELILTVRKPDLLGATKWQFKHGRSNFNASIEDARWIQSFRDRKFAIYSGDAIRCTVKVEYLYDKKGSLKSQSNYIVKIHEIIALSGEQQELF